MAQSTQSTPQRDVGSLQRAHRPVSATPADHLSPLSHPAVDDSGWEPDGVTLHVRFCEGGGTYQVTGIPAASVAIRRVTGGCEAYTARKQAARIQLRHLLSLRRRRRYARRKAASGQPLCEVVSGSPESLARGMLSSGFPANPGELTTSRERWASVQPTPKSTRSPESEGYSTGSEGTLNAEKPVVKGDRRRRLRVEEQSYEPILPMKVENRRAPARGGHGIRRREGANR